MIRSRSIQMALIAMLAAGIVAGRWLARATRADPQPTTAPGRPSPSEADDRRKDVPPEVSHAIDQALEWFTANQEPDGRFSARKHGGTCSDDCSTALAVACYIGAGTLPAGPGKHDQALGRAVKWLLKNRPANNDWTRGTGHGNGMYTHGIVTLALVRTYAATRDKDLLAPTRGAVDVILKAQNQTHGGWRYTSTPRDGDTSILVWQVVALAAARDAGLDVPKKTFDLAEKWLVRVGGGKSGGLYGYTGRSPAPAMVAAGMVSSQLLGHKPTEDRMVESATYIEGHLPRRTLPNDYYLYHGTMAARGHGDKLWDKWRPALRRSLVLEQVRGGRLRGSWHPRGPYGRHGGRVYSTALATLSLQISLPDRKPPAATQPSRPAGGESAAPAEP